MSRRAVLEPHEPDFYVRSVHEVARDLLGCTVRHGGAVGRIVETESYHEDEPACHAHIGLTPRTATLFGPPGRAYVYRSYGIHALLNVVAEREEVGAAVLIRALEPISGVESMERRRGGPRGVADLCSGPGKLTQALAIDLALNGAPLAGGGPIVIEPRPAASRPVALVSGERIGITKAVELPWRHCDAGSDCVSRPWPPAMRSRSGSRGRAAA